MNIIAIIHFIYIVLFVIVPFITNKPLYLAMHIVFGIGMVFHWIMNSDICFLTWLEHKLFNVPINKTFMDRLVGAVYRISDKQVQYATYFLFIFFFFFFIFLFSQTKLSFLVCIVHQ